MASACACLRMAAIFGVAAALFATAADASDSKTKPVSQQGSGSALVAPPGPKRTIAVGAIDAAFAYASPAQQNVGGAVAAMMTTALQESGLFIVVERAALSSLVTEQELATSGVAAGTAAPKPGKVAPAQYIVVGAVTEFSQGDSGGGLGVGGTGGGLGGGLALGRNKGRFAVDLRVVDTTTGEVLKAFKVVREVKSTTFGVTANKGALAVNSNAFWKTPLGLATREAVDGAVAKIAEALSGGPWRGQVVEVEGGQVIVNAGEEAGVKVGDQMTVERVGKTLTDPGTGQILSQSRIQLGTVSIQSVEARIATGRFSPSGSTAPVRGDFLVLRR